MKTEGETGDIAIIGLSGRFPGANNIDEFWQNLADGVESAKFFSDEELLAAGVDSSLLSQPNYIKAGYVLDNIDLFDASFFNISPNDAKILDPQSRLFMECVWEALEHSGYCPDKTNSLTGIYAGASLSSYMMSNLFCAKRKRWINKGITNNTCQ